MACVAGMINGYVSSSTSSSSSWGKLKNSHKKKAEKGNRGGHGGDRRIRIGISCVSTSPVASDPYKTLSIRPGASESEVKKAFRQLALKYHPDVCRGSNCGVQFHQINEAYDTVMSNLRDGTNDTETNYGPQADEGIDESMRGMDDEWEMWEEWMGWEGAGIRDYSSHINPYI